MVSFYYYYDGAVYFLTVPPMQHSTLHRYDILKEKMVLAEPLAPLLNEITETLKSGGRVWLVGHIRSPAGGALPPSLPPAPQSSYGWSSGPYIQVWEQQVAHFMMSHGREIRTIPPLTDKPVNGYENAYVGFVSGWR